MIHRAFMARLWTSFRSAVHEFKISRMQRKSDSRFRVVEVRKCDRRRYSSSGCRPRLSTRCNQIKRAVRRRAVMAATAVSCPKLTTKHNANPGFSLVVSGELGGGEEQEEEEEEEEATTTDPESVTDEGVPFTWTRWREIEIGDFTPRDRNQREIAAISSSKSMEEFGSLKWDVDGAAFLTSSASTNRASARHLGESASASASYFDHRRWENRVSYKTPQLMQPLRGKLTTLSSLLRTISDRYARRKGRLTPFHERAASNSNNNKRPVLTQSLSAMPWRPQPQHRRTTSAASRIVDDVLVKRYDNPFQDFLRQSIAERGSRNVQSEAMIRSRTIS